MELTEQALRNVESGATDGPGTTVCRGCGGPKEPTRLNSARCRECGAGGSKRPAPNKTVSASLPVEVWERLNSEAAESGQVLGAFLRDLIVKRDGRKHG